MTLTKTLTLSLFGSAASLLALQPAVALDAQAFVDRFETVYESFGYALEFGATKLKGDTIVVEGVTVGLKGMEDSAMTFDTELTFSGVTELPDGGFMARQMTLPDVETDIEEEVPGHVSLKDIVLEGLYLPGGDAIDAQAMMQLYGTMRTGPLSITRNGAEVFSIQSMEAGNVFNPAQGSAELVDIASHMNIKGLSVDLSTVKDEDPAAGATIEGLGLTRINGDIAESLKWTMADGRMVVDQFLFDFADVGAVDIKVDIAGLTPALLDQIYAMQASMLAEGTDPASEEAQAAQMMAGMQIAQALTITSASVRYDDASIAGRLLDFFAAQQGIERAQLVEGLKAMVPQMVAGAGIPALGELVAGPTATFLDDPQSVEVSIQPATPASILVLSAAAANPAGLINALGLTVTANQAAQ